MKTEIEEIIELPQEVSAAFSNSFLTVKGPKGELKKEFKSPKVALSAGQGKIKVSCARATKREKRMVYTFISHIKNMVVGVQKPFVYKLKICSGHFPMNVTVTNGKFQVKNFLGEKNPRVLNIKPGANIKIEGEIITIESPDKDIAGQVASDIELLTRITDKDLRRFQDGIYITEKAGKRFEE